MINNKIVNFVNENNYLELKNDKVICQLCKISLKINKNSGICDIKKHVKTKKHTNNLDYVSRNNPDNLSELKNTDNVHKELVTMLLKTNIPINVVDLPDFKKFFSENFNFSLMSGQTYRQKFFKELKVETKEKVKKHFYGKFFCIYLDETCDVNGRYILNIFGKTLENTASPILLLNTIELKKTNCETIFRELMFLIPNLTGDDQSNRNNFKAIITDGAAYCIKLGKELKKFFGNVKHVVCLCHNLHILAEEIRKKNNNANSFISELKKSLIKNKTNSNLYHNVTRLPMIKFPVITRWGTFISCAVFLHDNFSVICDFIDKLDKDSYSILKALANNETLIFELKHVASYSYIAQSIKKLESHNLPLKDQMRIYFNVKTRLADDYMKLRFDKTYEKNPDIDFFSELYFSENPIKNSLFNFINLTTVSVERSFSFLRSLLSEKRRALKSENIFNYLAVKTNDF